MSAPVPTPSPLIDCVDLFAGWGGFTVGAEQAGARVVYAANHWELAVEAHARNHPHTRHECQDLRQADWTTLPAFDLLLAAPACQGHSTASRAKRRPHHDALRATAFAVVDCADVTEPRAIIVENVPDFREWRLYRKWCEMLETIGYQLEEHILTASGFGVPQRRRRLFIVARRRGGARLELEPATIEPPIGPCIDWDAGDWRPITAASKKAQERIAAGRRHGRRYLIQHVTGHRGIPLHEPIRTVTCQDQWAVVDGDRYRPLTIRETARAMGFPEGYAWPERATRRECQRGLGNAVCPPVGRELVRRVAEAA